MDSDTTQHIFSTRLYSAAEAAKVSQRDISRKFGVSANTVNDWFKGKSFPGLAVVDQLASFLGVTPQWLFGADEFNPERDSLVVQIVALVSELGSIEGLRHLLEVAQIAKSEEITAVKKTDLNR